MGMLERDYILRVLEQLGATIAQIRQLRTEGRPVEAEALLDQVRSQLLGSLRHTLTQVDASTVAALLGSAAKVRGYAELLTVEAEVCADRSDADRAYHLRRRAIDLYRQLLTGSLAPSPASAADRAAVAALETLASRG